MPSTDKTIVADGPLSKQIAVIVCSQRTPRVGLQIGTFVFDTLKQYHSSHPFPVPYELVLVDMLDHPLPMFDEPGIPSQIRSSSDYAHAHTRAWSELISSFGGFVFVTPQYNWGYPASIKNAIDYLYHEWAGKPAMVVSYGGHGGGKAAAQLKQVLQGVRMMVVPDHVELAFPNREVLVRATTGADLELNGADEGRSEGTIWVNEKQEVTKIFAELLVLLAGTDAQRC
ncbi:NAD(P)H-dependent FMN reductase LOT6 [Exophiala dermatitidis]